MRCSSFWVGLGAGLLAVVYLQPAAAISEKNRSLLAKHFTELGTVKHELYAPLGGPELGAAVIDSGSPRLEVVEVAGREFKTLLTLGVPASSSRAPFTFLMTGQHLLTYPAIDWTDEQGLAHRRGDLTIYDLAAEGGPKKLYELKDVLDLYYEAVGSMTPQGLLWQPKRHFLNEAGLLPVKNQYFRLELDQQSGAYKLYQHLTALPDAAVVDAANINNRALLYYYQGRLTEAARLLEHAAQLAEADQSVVMHNQAMVKSELTDLSEQGNLMPERMFDEALAYYWQGDYSACLRTMEGRSNFSDAQLAMLGLALAQTKRWPEVDRITVELEHRQAAFFADYLAELVTIARFQRFFEIAQTYLLALQVTDKQHPGYAANLAALYALQGDSVRAEQLLQSYLSDQAGRGRDLSQPRLELYTLYFQRSNTLGCEELARAAQAEPLANLQGVVQLLDFIDFSAALTDVPLEEHDRIQAPEEPLEGLGLPDAPENPIEQGWHEIHEGEDTQ